MAEHDYTTRVTWTGNRGNGTKTYLGYDRTWNLESPGKPVLACSNDPLLGGDPSKYNPEDMLIGALSACHMLWFLHLASDAGVAVQAYTDNPVAVGETDKNGASRFLRCTLRPVIEVPKGTDLAVADAIHHRIHETCFIARSVNFPVDYAAQYTEI